MQTIIEVTTKSSQSHTLEIVKNREGIYTHPNFPDIYFVTYKDFPPFENESGLFTICVDNNLGLIYPSDFGRNHWWPLDNYSRFNGEVNITIRSQ